MSDDETVAVVITADGYLRMPPEFCARHFPSDRAAGLRKDDSFILMPASVYAPNGIIMKQRNLAGERSTLIREVWGDEYPVGELTALWQGSRRRLVIGAGVGVGVQVGDSARTGEQDFSGTPVHTVREDGV